MRVFMRKIGVISMIVSICVSQLFVLAKERDAAKPEKIISEKTDLSEVYRSNEMGSQASVSGQWIKNSDGRWWYRHADGTYTRGGWEYIAGQWYLFDAAGWMLFGWQQVGGTWYYLGTADDGAMKTGWQQIGGAWYYLGSANDGAMKTGWQKIGEYWYFFLVDGRMNTGNLVQGSRSYWFHSSGHLITTIINIVRQRQEKSRWCWVASAVMIGRYGTNSSISQAQAVRYVKGAVVNEGGYDTDVVAAIKYVSQGGKNPKAVSTKSYSYVVNNIDQNKLLGIHMSWSSGGGHMIVGVGYSLGGNTIYCIDPWGNTQNRYYNYASLVNGTTILTGRGRCTSLIVY